MTQKNNLLPLFLALLITGGLLGSSIWVFLGKNRFKLNDQSILLDQNDQTSTSAVPSISTIATANLPFAPPTQIPSGTQIFIDGSTSMAQFNAALKTAFESKFSGTRVNLKAQGSSKGIEALIAGQIDIAASSRSLKPEESNAGLKSVPVLPDQIAVVVGLDNALHSGLTTTQVADIFTGKITNWSQVGGENLPIRVLNRPPVSGTYVTFKELALDNQEVSGAGVITLPRDETTGLLRQLGIDGIGYATYNQVKNQTTVRTIPINNYFPEQPEYPFQRQLYYVYKEPASPAAKAFIGFLGTPEGQAVLESGQ